MALCDQDAIVLLGDSITQYGWDPSAFVQRLASDYARKLDIINRGMSGYNTRWAIPVFKQMLTKRSERPPNAPVIRLLTIWFGANDACLPHSVQHVPLQEYAANLTKLIDIICSPSSPYYSPLTKVIVMTPPPINGAQRAADLEARDPPGPKPVDRTLEVANQYAEAVRNVVNKMGEDYKVVLCDAFLALWNAAGKDEEGLSKYLSDGLHLNTDGYTVVYKELSETIKGKIPELYHENLKETFALWSEIDADNLDQTLLRRNIFA